MRLKLFLLALFMVGKSWALITVCASGCNDTTITNAIATATATPNSVIQINDSSITSESINLSGANTSLTLQGISPGIVWGWGGSGVQLTLSGTSLASPVTLKNITLNTTGASGNQVINWSGIAVGESLYLKNVTLLKNAGTAANGAFSLNTGLASANQLVFDTCTITQNASSAALAINGVQTVNNSVKVTNSKFKGMAGQACISIPSATSSNTILTVQNSDIFNSGTGLIALCGVTFVNCLFTGNTTDYSLTAPATFTMFTYTGFQQAASGGTSCVFGITPTSEYCDQTSLFISPASKTRNKGVSINGLTGATTGINGITQGQACSTGNSDMGCNPYSPALCGGLGVGK